MLDKNDVMYLSPLDDKEIMVHYGQDIDTFTYVEFRKFNFNKIDVLCRTEHLMNDEIDLMLEKLKL